MVKTNSNALMVVIDAGTTGIKCVVYDTAGQAVASAYTDSVSHYPKPGWVEQDADMVIERAFQVVGQAMHSETVDPAAVVGLCITAQRNTWVPIDKDGHFLTPMFIWQDQRGTEMIPWMKEQLSKAGLTESDFYRRIGQPFTTFQPGSKTFWFRQNLPELYEKTYKFVTPHDFLSHEFGAEGYHDSISDISSWMVTDGESFQFDQELMQVFCMDADKYTEHVTPGTCLGHVSKEAATRTGLPEGTPILSASGDQECGAVGVGNYGTGDLAVASMGTAGQIIGYSEKRPRHPQENCQVHGHPAGGYTIEAHASSCTSSFRWMQNLVASDVVNQAKQTGENQYELISQLISQSPAGANGILFLPWLQGAGCPYFDDNARGVLLGMSLATTKADVLRAAVEGICFDMKSLAETLQQANLKPFRKMKVFGGISRDPLWNQALADIMGLPIETMTTTEATALGAAVIGFVGVGAFDSFREATDAMCHVSATYYPNPEKAELYQRLYQIWKQCYEDIAHGIYPAIHQFQEDHCTCQ